MAANSLPRRIVKHLLAPLLPEAAYSRFQAVAMARDIRTRNWWEPEIELVDRVLREGDTAIDIGANFGLWAWYMSRAVGSTGKVYCFEPIPFTARTFRHVSRILGFGRNVTLIDKGCGERAERVEFTVPVMDTGAISAGIVHMGRNDERPGKEKYSAFPVTRKVACEVVRIDDELPAVERVTLIKCDIEGADLFALRGARRTIERHKPLVVVEITPWYLEGFGLEVTDVTSFFDELGYRCYHYDDDGKLSPASAETIVEDNWVFVHPANAARVGDILPASS